MLFVSVDYLTPAIVALLGILIIIAIGIIFLFARVKCVTRNWREILFIVGLISLLFFLSINV